MDVPNAQPPARRGAAPARGGGLHTILFFGLITIAVGAAGLVGVAFWGPEETVKNRTHLATDPPPPIALPSLPPEAPPTADAPPATADSAAAAPSAEPAASAKRPKKAPKAGSKKGR